MIWDFQKIEYFLKVAETLSFTRAAQELFISTQAINKQVLQLEESVGEKLFVRTTRSVALTEFGRQFYEAFRPVQAGYYGAFERMQALLGEKQDSVRILFFNALPKAGVVSVVANCLLYYAPGTDIRLEATDFDPIYGRLKRGEADLCITNRHEYEHWEGLEAITLAKIPAQAVVSLLHPWAAREQQLTATDMARMPVLLLARRTPLEEDSFYRHIPAAEKHYAPDFATLLAYLDLGRDFAVFPRLFENARESKLRFLDLPDELGFSFEMVCAYRRDNLHAALFEKMRAYFEEAPLVME